MRDGERRVLRGNFGSYLRRDAAADGICAETHPALLLWVHRWIRLSVVTKCRRGETKTFNRQSAAVSAECERSQKPCGVLFAVRRPRLDSELQTLDSAASHWRRVPGDPAGGRPGHSLTETPNQCLEQSVWRSKIAAVEPVTFSFLQRLSAEALKLRTGGKKKRSEGETLRRNSSWLLIHFYAPGLYSN